MHAWMQMSILPRKYCFQIIIIFNKNWTDNRNTSHLFHSPWQLYIPAWGSTWIGPFWFQLIGCTQSHDCKPTIKHVIIIPLISNRTTNITHTYNTILMHLSYQSPIHCNIKNYTMMLLSNNCTIQSCLLLKTQNHCINDTSFFYVTV